MHGTNPSSYARGLAGFEPFPVVGRVCKVHAGEIEADGPDVTVGMQCDVSSTGERTESVRALVAAVSDSRVKLVPFASVTNVRIGDAVRAVDTFARFAVGDQFAGRAIDGLSRALDGRQDPPPSFETVTDVPPLDRISPNQILATGIRSIDGLLTLGRGQRIGIVAPSGVGKTQLVNQILAMAEYDRAVVCLVGERGREVEATWRQLRTGEAPEKATLVAATSEETAPMRVRAVDQALALAQYWRSRGESVLFVLDSVTRYAMALREIGLVAGEPPTARAYTPNVFRELPRIVEGCGASRKGGAITAIVTVLSESEESDDPLVEIMKSLLDGHIVLSRALAQAGHFPAIDIGRSVSRLFDALVDREQYGAASRVRSWLAKYDESRILVASGMYKSGTDRELDVAIAARGGIERFLRQGPSEGCSAKAAKRELSALVNSHGS